eukprot:21535-Amphidinium_carterae.1
MLGGGWELNFEVWLKHSHSGSPGRRMADWTGDVQGVLEADRASEQGCFAKLRGVGCNYIQ